MAKLYFHYSSMNAGKSTALLQANHNYIERGMRPILYTAALDDRDGQGKIRSRIGIEEKAETFVNGDDLYQLVKDMNGVRRVDCLLIDEAQFLNKDQVAQLGRLVDEEGIPVLTYGIRTDFLGEAFEGSRYLMAWADEIKEIKTICHCGKKATMNARVDASGKMEKEGEQIEIGGNERYVSLCRSCFAKGQTGL
ncbi:MAG: thymidine kinase [Verrucomicrobiota bacterium]|nr:thymidine kinase [Verrucomicrobiota bacterium]MEC8656068.1 thymidine kinase [Verrucomicrobiota bacterium]MEC8777585.1 thymidine kinase [Verrucomicrobiota bacterium]MEC8791785.1 thymidine kinase [Verrucomicrobiota bacterium]MED5282131.1 thymidine kinase [Verrucomicrobiota bacterium]